MPEIRTLTKGFAGGEVAPEMWGQIDSPAYQTGLETCRNFIVLPHGPAVNRPGTKFVRAVKDSAKAVRVMPFSYSATQTMVLEVGDSYMRFHTSGATLEASPGVPYEIATTYGATDLFSIKFTQSNDVLTLVHTSHPPAELRRLGALSWTLTDISFNTTLAAPVISGITGTGASAAAAGAPSAPTKQGYVVTAVDSSGVEESIASSVWNVTNALTTLGNYNRIAWSAITGASRYNVYSYDNGLYGLIGQTPNLTFDDDNITPDFGRPPPEASNPFSGVDDYPGAVGYFEQRRAFAGTNNSPQNIYLTQSGTETNMNAGIPSQDKDAINYRIAARENNTIRHIVPLQDLLLFTNSLVWRVTGGDAALTATTFNVKAQSGIGASDVAPVLAAESVIYVAARGGHVRGIGYSNERGGYSSSDISMRAPHLFDLLDIVDMAWVQAPYPVLWAVSSDGRLLGMTFMPEAKVVAWHQHDTDGFFESVCVVTEGDEDAVYVVVRRTVNGSTVRYIERFASRAFDDLADAYFVDAGASYDGAPISTVNTGLSHLEGCTVSILADGAVQAPAVVTGGAVTLVAAASKIHIGLPIVADLKTLPAAFDADGAGRGRVKNVNAVFLQVVNSSIFYAGRDFDNLNVARTRTDEVFGEPPSLQSGEITVELDGDWNTNGQAVIRHTDPTPLTAVSLCLGLVVGGG